MKIGLDARILAHHKCGISTYVCNLIKNFLDLDKEIEIFLFSDNSFYPEYKEIIDLPHIHKVVFAFSKREKRRWAQRYLPKKLDEYKIDLYHAVWNDSVPFFRPCPCILTIHDLIPWVLGYHFKNKRKALRYKLRHFFSAHRADLIITPSDRSKNDIANLCRIRKDKIRVIPLGVEDEFGQRVDDNEAAETLGRYNLLEKNYFIDPAGIDHPRRNPIFVLNGFNQFRKIIKKNFYLVYTGNFYPDSREYINLIGKINDLKLNRSEEHTSELQSH